MTKKLRSITWLQLIWLTTALAYATPHTPHATKNAAAAVNRELLDTIKSYMDFEENPCVDFYQYACGNWEYVHWDEQKYVDTIGSLEYETNEELAQILERIIAQGVGRRNVVYRKMRDHYQACKAVVGQHDVETYLELLRPAGEAATWPYRLGERRISWQAKGFNWLETLGKLRAYGLDNVLLKEELKNKNATDFIMLLDKPDVVDFGEAEQEQLLLLKRSQHVKDKIIATKLLAFRDKLMAIHGVFSDAKPPQLITLRQLQQKVAGLDVSSYLAQLEVPADPHMLLLVSNIAYMRKLVELVDRTSKETLAAYIMLKLVSFLKQQLPASNSANQCMQQLRQHMPLAVDYLYEREHYALKRNESDAVIQRVFGSMQLRFEQIIDEHASEFSAPEMEFLKQKIKLMHLNIGNLPSNVGADYYQQYYQHLHIEPHKFAENLLASLRHLQSREHYLLQLRTASPEHSFFSWRYASPAYLPTANMLLIPFAYLRRPIFHRHYHELFLFAELGNTLGHEMIHGFDMTGLKYDAWGNPSAYFNSAMARAPFLSALSCLQREATTNINEKIADFSGFRLAYESYFQRPHVPRFYTESALTNKQLFFVKFAQFFCAVSPNRISYDQSHDTPFQRVPQAVANYVDFAKEFGCKKNTRMNPLVRCNLW